MKQRQSVLELKAPVFGDDPVRRLRPIDDLVYLQLDHAPEKSGVVLASRLDPGKTQAGLAQAKVLSVGPKASGVESGDVVLVAQHNYSGEARFQIFEDRTALYVRDAVVAVVEHGATGG